jgi:hypothetical protein
MPIDPFEYPPKPRFTAGIGIAGSIFALLLFGFFAPVPLKWFLLVFAVLALALSLARYITNTDTVGNLFRRR